MAKKYDDGGPAYPRPASITRNDEGAVIVSDDGAPGMSLHDWLAGKATDKDIRQFQDWVDSGAHKLRPKYTGVEARYRFADAMIAEKRRREAQE